MQGHFWVGCLSAVAVATGCVGVDQARARDKTGEVQEAVRLAEMRGIRDGRAVRQLQQARAELHDSQGLLERDPYRAISELTCAQADTELAVALEDEARARAEDRRVSSNLGSGAQFAPPPPTYVPVQSAPAYMTVPVTPAPPGVIIQ
jgi:hypothetical protein